jgi:diguanylate cyclase (GGDEF)-like protein
MSPSLWALGAIVVGFTAGVTVSVGWRRRVEQRTLANAERVASLPSSAPPTLASVGQVQGASTPRRSPSPDGTLPDCTIEHEVVERYLGAIRDALSGDDVLLWTSTDGGDLTVTASATGGAGPAFQISPSIDSLLRWAVDQGIPASNADTDESLFLVTPVGGGERLHGAVALYAADRRLVSRERVKSHLPRYAARLAILLDLLRDAGGARRYRDKAVLLAKAAERVQGSGDSATLGQAVCETAIEISGGTRAALVFWNDQAGAGHIGETSPGHLVASGFQVAADSFVGTACRERQRFTSANFSRHSALPLFGPDEPGRPIGSFAIAPLQRAHECLGAIVVEGEAESQITAEEGSLLQLLASLASQALQNVRRLEAATTASNTDALTALPNRRMFDDRLRHELGECQRNGHELSLIVADVDHFKRVNDSFGHEAGDAVLVAVARTVARSLRNGDLCARYGGEEIAVLLPRTPPDSAREVAERLRRAVEEVRVKVGGEQLGVTISLGVATYPSSTRTSGDLFAAADQALYTAKKAGRNRVSIAGVT